MVLQIIFVVPKLSKYPLMLKTPCITRLFAVNVQEILDLFSES